MCSYNEPTTSKGARPCMFVKKMGQRKDWLISRVDYIMLVGNNFVNQELLLGKLMVAFCTSYMECPGF